MEVQSTRQAVIIRLKLSDEAFGAWEEREAVYRLEDRLEQLLASNTVGEVDGHEFGDGFAAIYLYGPSADAIAELVAPLVAFAREHPGSTLTRRFGRPGAREVTDFLA